MQSSPHIAIIGGGLIGLSTADSLVHRGAKVTVFEQNSETGNGAGRYNSGMIHPSQVSPWFVANMSMDEIKTLFRWACHSRDLLMKRRALLGCEDFNRSPGTIQIFDSRAVGRNKRDYYNDIGIGCREYGGEWASGYYGIEFLNDESGSAYHYCHKLTEDLRRRGCEFRTDGRAEILKQNNIAYVKVENQSLEFDRIIVAAGAASREVLRPLGYNLPVTPLRGHALVFGRPAGLLPDRPIMHWDSRSALTVFDDHVRLSGTVGEEDPKALLSIWQKIAPGLVEALGLPLDEWSADRPHSEIGRPMIGATSIPNVWVNAGHGHMGWSLCSWSGEMLAQMMIRKDYPT